MARRCELTGKGTVTGNNVSHAHNKTRRTYLPNLTNVSLISDTLGETIRLRISTHALRSVEHNGGLDNFIVKCKDEKMSLKARRIKRRVKKALSAPAAV